MAKRTTIQQRWKAISLPGVWALIYLCAIPLFAFLYQENYSSFKISNEFTDTKGQEINEPILKRINHALNSDQKAFCSICEFKGLWFELGEISNYRMRGKLIFYDYQADGFVGPEVLIEPNSQIPSETPYWTVHFLKIPKTFHRFPTLSNDFKFKHRIEIDLGIDFGDVIDKSHGGDLYQVTSIRKKNSFTKFLYLSAVTITTLGYGDIVPIDDIGRTIVAIEAVFGIIIMGLFLSSLSRRR